jgi:hypothetical protein
MHTRGRLYKTLRKLHESSKILVWINNDDHGILGETSRIRQDLHLDNLCVGSRIVVDKIYLGLVIAEKGKYP